MPFRHSFYGFWAALLLFFGLLAPAAAQRGGDDGAYQILSARYGTSCARPLHTLRVMSYHPPSRCWRV